ncbi:MAG: universal stress protein [Gemmatimonadota bacterium]|nr:universal stress protein [Gemmatimonadota bacterium]MDH4348969.1 universal stress protein [Gemmatimonadota bacterium]MDH5282254.1 universal stress protein [Gemmatimonadota bacterium]
MFTSILVGLDGSLQAEVALSQAIKIGQRFRARLVLAHVTPPPGQTGEMALGAPWMEFTPGSIPASRVQHEQAARDMLEESAGAGRRAGLEVETIWRQGLVPDILRALAEDVGVVVVGRTGVQGAKDPLGPETRELIRRCPRPVLVCGTTTTAMDRVLVAYGGGPASEGALAFATRFASITGAHLDVVHVSRDAEAGARAIARASGALSLAMVSFDLHSVEGDLEQGIGEAVERFGADTVFAGATKEGEAWLVPSHTEAILRATDIPVLVHMPPVPSGARTTSHRNSPSG